MCGGGGRGVGGMTGVAYIITGNDELKEQTALNRVCYFHFFWCTEANKYMYNAFLFIYLFLC